jgi:hypothetical protein
MQAEHPTDARLSEHTEVHITSFPGDGRSDNGGCEAEVGLSHGCVTVAANQQNHMLKGHVTFFCVLGRANSSSSSQSMALSQSTLAEPWRWPWQE